LYTEEFAQSNPGEITVKKTLSTSVCENHTHTPPIFSLIGLIGGMKADGLGESKSEHLSSENWRFIRFGLARFE
jgi:hypothetical protein